MAAKGGHIDFMFLAPPLTRLLDPLLQSSSVTIISTCKLYDLFLSDFLIVKN